MPDQPAPVYREYHLSTPHCAAATAYRDVSGATVWRCRHYN